MCVTVACLFVVVVIIIIIVIIYYYYFQSHFVAQVSLKFIKQTKVTLNLWCSFCLCLSSFRITGLYHHTLPLSKFLIHYWCLCQSLRKKGTTFKNNVQYLNNYLDSLALRFLCVIKRKKRNVTLYFIDLGFFVYFSHRWIVEQMTKGLNPKQTQENGVQ